MNDRFSADDLPRRGGPSARPSPWPIDLAHTKRFRIGDAEVRPATREIIRGDQREVLEPLVMQVLVALHNARGDILSRDDLIDACWGGRVVTDDAVNRVVSRLRALGRKFGSFEVETVTKVGYRLIDRQAPYPGTASTPIERRTMLIGAGASVAALATLGYFSRRKVTDKRRSAESQVLLENGEANLRNNDIIEGTEPGTIAQTLALLSEATRSDPKNAQAWAALAVAYAVRRRSAPQSERAGFVARSRAAARTALELDPENSIATIALRLLDPPYRQWGRVEATLLNLVANNPTLTPQLAHMSNFYGNVGRWREAVKFTRRIDRQRYQQPGGYWRYMIDLWGSGDLKGADDALENAVRHWPQNPQLFRTQIAYLMYSGRPREALARLDDFVDKPTELQENYLIAMRQAAEGIAGLRPKEVALQTVQDYARSHPPAALLASQAIVALGAGTRVFAMLDGYYFGEGDWAMLAPAGGDEDRITHPLFQPVMQPIWKTQDFAALLQRIGLEDYWRQSRSAPDFRRVS